jgi:hypothetical protein
VADTGFYIPSEALRLIDQEDSTNVPTVLLYQNGGVLVGYEALRAAARQRALLNEDIKLGLGLAEARSQETRKNFPSADGGFRSADDLDAFVQATSMVNDHLPPCFRYQELR